LEVCQTTDISRCLDSKMGFVAAFPNVRSGSIALLQKPNAIQISEIPRTDSGNVLKTSIVNVSQRSCFFGVQPKVKFLTAFPDFAFIPATSMYPEILAPEPEEPEKPKRKRGKKKGGRPRPVPLMKLSDGRTVDIYSKLLMERTIFLEGSIDDPMANVLVGQLLHLASVDPNSDIKMFINSRGGSVTAGMAIYDVMNYIKPDVQTICCGMAASMAAFLLCSGKKGKRFIYPHSTVMIHQPLGGTSGDLLDVTVQVNEVLHHKRRLGELMAIQCGQTIDKINKDCDRDTFLTSDEALAYGLVDHIVPSLRGPASEEGYKVRPANPIPEQRLVAY